MFSRGRYNTLHPINHLSEVRLFPTPEVTLHEIKNFSKTERRYPRLVSLGKNHYVINRMSEYPYKIQEMSLSKLGWMSVEKTGKEYSFFLSIDHGAAHIRIEPWADLYSQYEKYSFPEKSGKCWFFCANMWYFFHDCFDANFLHD